MNGSRMVVLTVRLFCVIGKFVPITQKRSAGMRTAAYNVGVASDRRRRKNVPRHILCSCVIGHSSMRMYLFGAH